MERRMITDEVIGNCLCFSMQLFGCGLTFICDITGTKVSSGFEKCSQVISLIYSTYQTNKMFLVSYVLAYGATNLRKWYVVDTQ